jgi:hypothetical protein
MADEKQDSGPVPHGDDTAPANFSSPATFVPLSKEPQSVDQKTDRGKTGKD